MFCQGLYDCYHPYLLGAQSWMSQPVGHLIKAIKPAEPAGEMMGMAGLMYVLASIVAPTLMYGQAEI